MYDDDDFCRFSVIYLFKPLSDCPWIISLLSKSEPAKTSSSAPRLLLQILFKIFLSALKYFYFFPADAIDTT